MAEHPIQGLMNVTMEKIHQMVDSNTIIGKPITTEDGINDFNIYQKCGIVNKK